ncbi:MAG: type I glutamate--ammonia ligase [Gammaproteobacteria bacterium]|nr:type I glutamate--ammonia ligase [Gammaproteobacteria bacterium]
MTPKEIIDLIKAKNIEILDLKFQDFPGTWQHFSIPVSQAVPEIFDEGLGFDGSSIRGWQAIHASDMLVVPDPVTAVIDPFTECPTLSLICNIVDPVTREQYSRDPRYVAVKAENYLKSSGIGDVAYFGPEAEFFIFDGIRFDQNAHEAYYHVESAEGVWDSGSDNGPNLGYKPRHKEGYFPVPPTDSQQDIRTEMILEMEKAGIVVEKHHHEVATAGQAEIDLLYDSLTRMADKMMMYKYIVKNVALRHGKTVTFMPKPLFGDNGSGMHTHQSIWKGGQPLFAGDKYAGVSDLCLWYIGGILKHAPALCAFVAPTTNSYKRLVPGFEAPVNLAYSSRNRSASIRIPVYSPSPKAKRIEVRFPDPSCNPYLAFAAMLMAGLDGIMNKINPGDPLDKNLYDLPPEELAKVPSCPASLEAALDALEKDHDFLFRGNVFTADVVETWLDYKRTKECDPIRLRPHPYEFALYYDA